MSQGAQNQEKLQMQRFPNPANGRSGHFGGTGRNSPSFDDMIFPPREHIFTPPPSRDGGKESLESFQKQVQAGE